MQKRIIYFLFLASLLVSSCTSSSIKNDITISDGYGAISFNLETNLDYTTRANSELLPLAVPTVEDFTISITAADTESEQEPFTSEYNNLPLAVELLEGEYNIEATSGEDIPFSTTTPEFLAQTTAEVNIGHITEVPLVAKMHSYAVQIRYSEEFLNNFTSYHIEAMIGSEFYQFANGKNEVAYFAPGECRLFLKGVTTSGKEYSSIFSEISSEGTEHYILNLNIRPKGHSFEVEVDETIVNLDVTTNIDPNLYPDMPTPVAGSLQFYETGIYNSTEDNNSVVKFVSLTNIKNAQLEFFDEKFAKFGLDITKLYSLDNAQDVEELREVGVIITDGALGDRNVAVNFDGLALKLECENHDPLAFNFRAISTDFLLDKNGDNLTSEKICSLTVNPMQFTIPEVSVGNVWSKEFTINSIAQANISKGTLNIVNQRGGFIYKYSKDGSTWSEIDPATLKVAGLTGSTSKTKYYVRAEYRFYSSNTVVLYTEAQTQIPNNNFATNHSTDNGGQPCYWFFANAAAPTAQWWTTRNCKTTSEGIDAKYTRYSGARPTSGQGIELVTHGWGSGCTASGSWSMIYNVWAGAVFLGTYSPDSGDNSVNEHHGRDFESRPTAMTFSFKYAPYNNKGDNYIAKIWLENRTGGKTTELARGESTSTATVSSWTTQTVSLSYKNTTLPITHLCVAFYSGKNENPSDNENKAGYVKDPGFTKNEPSRGSVFNVNNVTLVYGR